MKIAESNRATCHPLNKFRTRKWLRLTLTTLSTAASLALCGLTALAAEPVTISEFLTGSVGGLVDEDLETPDWVELYNSGTSAVNLAGWHLTDDTNDLTRWTFPTTNIGPKGFLIIFASGKDRTVPGANLHTSFSLSSDGGYLALVKPDGVTIASEFVDYGEQRANYSYGRGAIINTTTLLATNASARVLVPLNGTLGSTWTAPGFVDTSWLNATNGVGYETTVPGFAVRNIKANITVGDLNAALGVTTNPGQQTSVVSTNAATIEYADSVGGGHYTGNRQFPGFTSDQEDFVLDITATITIPAAGAWTFGVNSDDGFRLTIGSFSVEFAAPRGPGDTLGVFTVPAAGDYPLRLVYYERGGGAEVELFAKQGSLGAWDTGFRLVGDTAGGGLAVRSLPVSGGGGLGYRSLIRTDVQSQMLNNASSAYVRIPFNVTNVAGLEALTLRLNYDDGVVGYLNGTEILRRNAPAVPAWNSLATAAHAGVPAEDINLTARIGWLVEGTNALALHGMNDALNSPDFLLRAEIVETKVTATTNQYFVTPTPGSFNGNSGFIGFVGDTKFSHDRGFYETNISVTITSATAGASLRYTLNGSLPSATSGTVYTGPIPMTNSTILRALAYKTGQVPSDVDTVTYLFLNDIIRQPATPPAGWPTANSAAGQIYNYGMDQSVVNANLATIKEDLKSIPTFSIVTTLSNLFDNTTGIYANPRSDERAFERGASLELINPNGTEGFQINCGLRIRGGFSRDPANPKHAFRFFFRQEYGANKLNYPLFGNQGADTFDKIDLRTMQNYSWAYQADGRMICVRDTFSRDAQLLLGQPSSHGPFYHLYVNGLYWGLYNIDERPEASYGETYIGGRAEDYDTIKVDPDNGYNIEATDGDTLAWNRLWNAAVAGFGSDSNYFGVQGLNLNGTVNTNYEALIDVDNMIVYMLAIIFGGNLDAPISNFLSNDSPNNWFGFRNRTGKFGGFRFVAHDSEHTLLIALLNQDRTGPFRAGDPAQGSTFQKSNPQYLWQQMSVNPEFRIKVADHVQRAFFNNGPFSTTGARQIFLTRSNEIWRAMNAESARWGDSKRTPAFTRATWITEYNQIVGQYCNQRPAIVLNQLRAKSLVANVAAASFNHYGGVVSNGFRLYMTNGNPGSSVLYYTLNGSDPRLRGGTIAPGALAFPAGSNLVINFQVAVKARVYSNGVWSAISQGTYFPLQNLSQLVVSEIMYNPPAFPPYVGDDVEFLELKNAGMNTLDLSGCGFLDGITFAFTNGTRLLAGQVFLLGRNQAALAAKYPGVTVHGIYSGRLDNGGEQLTITNLTGSPVLSFAYEDSDKWPRTADGLGFSIALRDPAAGADPDRGTSWRASVAAGGSPGSDEGAYTIVPIVINELIANSVFPEMDRVELFNPTASPVNIGGWFLTDNTGNPKAYRIPDGSTLDEFGFKTFSETNFNPTPGTNGSFAFSSLGEEIFLFSGDANTNLTGYSYGFAFGGSDEGTSFGRYVNNAGDEHFVSQISPTVADTNSGPRVGPLIFEQIMYHPPDLAGGADNSLDEYLLIRNIATNDVPLFDPAASTNTWRLRGGTDFDFPTNVTLLAGEALVLVNFNPTTNAAQVSAFRARYSQFTNTPLFGPYSGKLDNAGQSVELNRPGVPTTNGVPRVLVEQIDYRDAAPWSPAPDGSGSVLQRRLWTAYGNDATNWRSAAPLSILTQPQSILVSNQFAVTFSVNALGTGNLLYQWKRDGGDLADATNTFLTLSNLTPAKFGAYTVRVTDELTSALSASAQLAAQPLLFLLQPQSVAVTNGSNTTLTARANGYGTVRYQWQFFGTNLPGAISSNLALVSVGPSNAGPYTVRVEDDSGASVLSQTALVQVLSRPTIIVQPTNTYVLQGGTATFFIEAVGTTPISFRWRRAGVTYTNGIVMSTPTNSTLMVTNVGLNEATNYTCVVTNTQGQSPVSQIANLFLATIPVFTVQPASQMVDPGTNVTFSAMVTSSPAASLQWYFNGSPLAGETGLMLSLNNVQPSSAGPYFVVAANPVARATSQVATLSFNSSSTPPSILTQPQSLVSGAGSNVTFLVLADGSAPLAYQWRRDGTNLPAASSNELALLNVTTNDEGGYDVVVMNSSGSVTSVVATLTLDTDSDGMPDVWEFSHGLNPLDPGDATGDLDDDQSSNRDEYIAGTDPLEALNYLRIEGDPAPEGGAAVLHFIAVSNRVYSVQCSPTVSGTWVGITNILSAPTNRTIWVTNAPAGPVERYYRLVIPTE